MKRIIPILGLILILAVVGISGCTSVQSKTYSNNGLNLTYPGDMNPNATFVFVTSPTNDTALNTLGNDKLKIAIAENNVPSSIKKYFSFNQYRQFVWAGLNSGNSTKYTTLYTGDKSKNGTTIYEEIYTSKDPVSGTELKNKRVVVFKDMNRLYDIIFQTKTSDFQSQQDTINNIENSIVLT